MVKGCIRQFLRHLTVKAYFKICYYPSAMLKRRELTTHLLVRGTVVDCSGYCPSLLGAPLLCGRVTGQRSVWVAAIEGNLRLMYSNKHPYPKYA